MTIVQIRCFLNCLQLWRLSATISWWHPIIPMHLFTWPDSQSKHLRIMPHIPTRLVLSQRTGPQQRQVRIHFIWHIYPSPQLPSSHRCQYSSNCRLSLRQNCYPLSHPRHSTVILPCLATSQTSVDLHIIASGHCVISGGLSQICLLYTSPSPRD